MSEQRALSDAMQEELVAYLDGELDADRQQRIERLIAEDENVRAELQRLQRTWDMLDELPTAEAGESFTRTTLAMATVALDEEIKVAAARPPRAQSGRLAAVFSSTILAAVIGYVAVKSLWPDPNEALLRDLSVLEHLDEYRQAGDVEFLRALADEKLFVEEVKHEPK